MQVFWLDKKGAGRMRSFGTAEDCWKFLDTLRCEATVRDVNGEIVGKIEHHTRNSDDKRRKWYGWLDMEAA